SKRPPTGSAECRQDKGGRKPRPRVLGRPSVVRGGRPGGGPLVSDGYLPAPGRPLVNRPAPSDAGRRSLLGESSVVTTAATSRHARRGHSGTVFFEKR